MKIRPLDDRIAVKRLPEPRTARKAYRDIKPGTVLLMTPDAWLQRSHYGQVIAVGPGRPARNTVTGGLLDRRVPCEVSVGERIWFGKYSDYDPDDSKVEGKYPVMVTDQDVFAVEREGRLSAPFDILVVRRDERIHGRIILTGGKPLTSGVVLAAGPGRLTADGRRVPNEVQAGDHITFHSGHHQEETIAGELLVILHAADAYAVLPAEQEATAAG